MSTIATTDFPCLGHHCAQESGAKAKVNLGENEFAAGLSFVAISRVRALGDLLFKAFTFDRLERIKLCKRLQERKEEEERLTLISQSSLGWSYC
jgi:hypothetical protein